MGPLIGLSATGSVGSASGIRSLAAMRERSAAVILGSFLLLTILLLLLTDLRSLLPGRDLRSQPRQQTTPVAEQAHQAQAAVTAAIQANMHLLSQHAELALPPRDRDDYWRNMGHVGQVPVEVSDFIKISLTPGTRVICEIGFNAGHSSSVFLTANPAATLYSFDLASLPYSPVSLALFRRAYPNRFNWVQGSSFDTVPWFKTKNITCDVFSVDGDHSYKSALTDFMNALKVMRVGSVLIADDVSLRLPGCRQAWQEVLDAGYLKDVQCSDNGPEEEVRHTVVGIKRWCWGTVASLTGALDSHAAPWPANTALFSKFRFNPDLPPVGQLQ